MFLGTFSDLRYSNQIVQLKLKLFIFVRNIRNYTVTNTTHDWQNGTTCRGGVKVNCGGVLRVPSLHVLVLVPP